MHDVIDKIERKTTGTSEGGGSSSQVSEEFAELVQELEQESQTHRTRAIDLREEASSALLVA